MLADAGTNGQVGPNLDHAFLAAREDGLGESTFFEVTLEQMRIPAAPMPDFDDPDSETRLSVEELVDIAHYVALCAGHAGKRKPAECAGPPEGPQAVFVASCGSCHALDAAGTTGTTGPSLDESKPGLQEAITQIKKGGGGMPAFEGKLSDEQINALAKYIVESTGGS